MSNSFAANTIFEITKKERLIEEQGKISLKREKTFEKITCFPGKREGFP